MQQNPAPWQCCSNPDLMAKLSSQALGAAHLHRYLQRRHLSHKASELQLQGRKIYYKQKSWPPPATSITHTGMTSMFFPMINSGLWETLLTFIPFFFPWTQVRDELLTLESSRRTAESWCLNLLSNLFSQIQRLAYFKGPLRTGQQLTLEYENPVKT